MGLMVILRGLAAVGIYPTLVPESGAPIGYNTFLRATVVFLLLSIASRLVREWPGGKS